MGSAAQATAVRNYRKRLKKRGMGRFEVVGLNSDRELIRTLARKLAEESREATEIRATVSEKLELVPNTSKKGGILAVLRSWPIADLNLERPFVKPRKIDL